MKNLLKLTWKNLKFNPKRTLVTIISVVLTSSLMFSLGFIVSSYRESEIKKIASNVGMFDVWFENIPYKNKNKINNDVSKISYIYKISDDFVDCNLYGISSNIEGEIKLKDGLLPKNSHEIIAPYKSSIKIGDLLNGYKVVGLSGDDNFYILSVPKDDDLVNFYVYFNSKKDVYEKIFDIATHLNLKFVYEIGKGKSYVGANVNEKLLAMYGNIRNSVQMAILFLSLLLLLTVLAIFATIIIYNSFAISVVERKKTLGMLASIGATKKDLFLSVILEGLIVFLIALPIGFVLSTVFVNICLSIVNHILSSSSDAYVFSMYPLFLFLPIIFILLTVFFSAFFPANKASLVSPLEAIKGSSDLVLKNNKEYKLTYKLFGITGLMARKNMNRSKKKYRITILAIVISVVMFITVSTLIYQYEKALNNDLSSVSEEISLNIAGSTSDMENIYKDIISLEEIDDFMRLDFKTLHIYKSSLDYSQEYKSANHNQNINLVVLNEEKYLEVLKELHIQKMPILINKIIVDEQIGVNTYRDKIVPVYKNNSSVYFRLCDISMDNINNENCPYEFRDVYLLNKLPKSLEKYQMSLYSFNQTMIVDKKTFESIPKLTNPLFESDLNLKMLSKKYDTIDNKIIDILKNYHFTSNNYVYYNYALNNLSYKKSLLVIKFVVYALIFFFALIATTSIINTTFSNISLRSREFAVLKSIGLDNSKLSRLITLESLFISLKALLIAIPISLGAVYVIAKILSLDVFGGAFSFPLKYFIISIVFVIVIVFATMKLASLKIKSANIIENIRNENI